MHLNNAAQTRTRAHGESAHIQRAPTSTAAGISRPPCFVVQLYICVQKMGEGGGHKVGLKGDENKQESLSHIQQANRAQK